MITFVLNIILFVKLISAGQKTKNTNINDSNIAKIPTNPHIYDEIDDFFGNLIDFDLEIDPKADFEVALLDFLESEIKEEESDNERWRPGDKKLHILEDTLGEIKNDCIKSVDCNNNEAEYVKPDDLNAEK